MIEKDFLETVVAERRAHAAALRDSGWTFERPKGAQRREWARSLRAALGRRRDGRLAVIAEVKRVSPALGALAPNVDPAAQARAYVAAGAAAISVLVEPLHWGGSLDDLRAVREAAPTVPVLAKDVIVDAVQIAEADAAGADAILLIAEAFDDAHLAALLSEARRRGMEVLVEAHEAEAFGRAVASGARIVGANARNLRRPEEIDRGRARLLHSFVRRDQIFVAESGIESAADAAALPARVDAVLVGTALMRTERPGELIKALAGVRRSARSPRTISAGAR